jgi:hypothetical protein
LAAKGVFVTVVVVSPAQRPSHGQLEPSRHRPPHLVWRSGPTQPGHPQIVCGALESRALVEKRAEIGRLASRGADPPPPTMDSRVRREPGGGSGFDSRRPGRGREK